MKVNWCITWHNGPVRLTLHLHQTEGCDGWSAPWQHSVRKTSRTLLVNIVLKLFNLHDIVCITNQLIIYFSVDLFFIANIELAYLHIESVNFVVFLFGYSLFLFELLNLYIFITVYNLCLILYSRISIVSSSLCLISLSILSDWSD